MWQAGSLTRPQRARRWLAAVLLVPSVVLGVSACGGAQSPPLQPETIADKGTPFGDLLVPKLAASVTDGAVGVPRMACSGRSR
jgi:hypothetical protein